MFSVVALEDNIKLKAEDIGKNIYNKNIIKSFEGKILGKINSYIIKIIDVNLNSIKEGIINDIDGSTNYLIKYTAVIFEPIKDQILDVIVKECNDNTIWATLSLLKNVNIIECIIPKKYIDTKYTFNEDTSTWTTKNNSEIIKVFSELKLKIVNFQIDSNKIMIIGSMIY